MDRTVQTVGVVVLNFNQYEETFRCVDSLLGQRGTRLRIVIVDNGSANDSCARLRERYSVLLGGQQTASAGQVRMTLLRSEDNLGFAGGMNLGIDCLRQGDAPVEFIFLANSDLVFAEPEILRRMTEAWRPGVGVINPTVINPDGTPALRVYFRKKLLYLRMLKTFVPAVERLRVRFRSLRTRTDRAGASSGGRGADHETGAAQKERRAGAELSGNRIHQEEYMVIGCGYMYGPDFFRYYRHMYPETFLYMEEYATILYLHKAGLYTMLADTGNIIHRHGASTPPDLRQNAQFTARMKGHGKSAVLRLMRMRLPEIQKRYH